MKQVLRILGSLLAAVILLVAGALFYSTLKGRTAWYFRVNGDVTVDQHKTSGYMHANTDRTILLVTRTDGPRPETYLVPLREGNVVSDCGEWHPLRFLPMPIGRGNPPCIAESVDQAKIVDPPVAHSLVRGRTSIEFSTASGRRVKAEW